MVRTLDEDLQEAQAFHGHLCHGMVMGVRMARYGCSRLGLDDPRSYRDLVVYVEMDRCAADAVSVVCGVTLGRRRLKWVDYGKLAATFVDLDTGRAVRIAPQPAVPHGSHDVDPVEFWKDWPDEALFSCTEVTVDIPEEDKPGFPLRKATCEECGELINDGREVVKDGRTLCRACARGAYYRR